jgi:hypothetical protein
MTRLGFLAVAVCLSVVLAGCSQTPAGPATAESPGVSRDAELEREFVRAGSAQEALTALGITGGLAIPERTLDTTLKAVYMAPAGMDPDGFVARYANGIEIKVMKMASADVVASMVADKAAEALPSKKLFKANGKTGVAYSKGSIDDVLELLPPGGDPNAPRRVKPGTGVSTSDSGAELQFGRYRILVTYPEAIDPAKLLEVVRDME